MAMRSARIRPVRLLVTGAAGFIGTTCGARACGAAGRPARDVERLVAGDLLTYAGNFANLADLASDPRFRFERLDIAQREPLTALVRDEAVDVRVHSAAESHVDRSIVDQEPFLHANVHGTLAVLEAARTAGGVRRVLQVSTDEVYGSIAHGHATEDCGGGPSSPYAASKAAADAFVQAYATTYGVPTVITRCSNNYGPYQFPEKLIPLFVPNALAGKRHWGALVHVPGLPDADGRVWNVSAANERPNRAVTDAILALTGRPADLVRYVSDRPGHDRRSALDAARLRATGWD